MASISKRGTKYIVRWRDPDGTERIRTVPDRTTAVDLRRDVERCVSLGTRWEPRDAALLPALASAGPDGKVDSGVFYDFIQVLKVGKAAETVRQYDIALMQFLNWLAVTTRRRRVTIDLLSQERLVGWWNHMTEAELALGTKRLRMLMVQKAWRWAAESDKYGDVCPRPRSLEMPTPTHRHIRAPSWAEMDAFIHACPAAFDAKNPYKPLGTWASNVGWRRRAAIIMRFTGLRIGQVMRLQWSDLDLDAAVLEVRPELGKSRQEKAGRRVPISPHLVAEFAGWGRREGWVVAPHKKQRTCIAAESRETWEAAKVPREIWDREPKGDPHHCFRKGFRSNLRAAGVDRDVIEFLIGHSMPGSDPSYQDPDYLPLRAAVALIPELTPANLIALPAAVVDPDDDLSSRDRSVIRA